MNFFRNVISHLLKQAEDGSIHSSFKVCDPTAVGSSPVRELSLDVVPLDESTSIISLAWKDSAEKILEKKTSSEEAEHISQLIQTDLAQLMKLTDENKYDEAKEVFKNVLKEYSQESSTPVATNMPVLNNTQAELDIDANLWKQAGQVKLQNIFPSGTVQNLVFENQEDLAAYQGKGKGAGKEVPLWEQEGKKAPESKDELSAPSLSYEDVEKQKEEEHESLRDHIDSTIKKELESALQEKAASVFGPEQVELVKVLRLNGRNWDEITKMLTKDFHYDKDATTIFVDQQRQAAGDEGIEIEKEEIDPLRPPENLVSPETHDKLLEDLKKDKEPVEEVKEIEKVEEPPLEEESAQKSICPECDGEGDVPAVRGGRVTAIPCPSCSGDKHIEHAPKELESAQEEIARADNADIRKVAADVHEHTCPKCAKVWKCHKGQACNEGKSALCGKHYSEEEFGKKESSLHNKVATVIPAPVAKEIKEEIVNSMYRMNAPHAKFYRFSLDGDKIYRGDYNNDAEFGPYQFSYDMEQGIFTENPNYKPTAFASLKQADEQDAEIKFEHAVDRLDKRLMKEEIHQEEYDVEMKKLKKEIFPKESALRTKVASYMNISEDDSIVKTAADDVNPLQEPISEEPTMTTPEQDRVPFGQAQHRAPKPESWVVVQSDLKGELPAFRGKFVSEETESDGSKWGIVDKDGELLKVEMHRITPETEGAQTTEPVAEPQIEAPKEVDVPVTPSLDSLHSASSLKVKAHSEFLNAPEDVQWLQDTALKLLPQYHGKFQSFMLHGNEDAPERLVLYSDVNPLVSDVPVASLTMDFDNNIYVEDPTDTVNETIRESSQDDLLTIKAEAEQLLKIIKEAEEQETFWDERSYDEKYPMMAKYPEVVDKIVNAIKEHGDNWYKVEQKMFYDSPFYMMNLSHQVGSREGSQLIDEVYKWLAEHEKQEDKVWTPRTYEQIESSLKEASDFEKGISQNKTADELFKKEAIDYVLRECESCGNQFSSPEMKNYCPKCGTPNPIRLETSLKVKADEDTRKILQELYKKLDKAEGEEAKKLEEQIKMYSYEIKKKADEPAVEPKTQFKDYKITPKYTPKEEAVPASVELDAVLSKMDALEQNLGALDRAKKEIQAKLQEEMKKIDQAGERVQMEEELQASIEKASVLIQATSSKVVQWRDKLLALKTEEIQYVPKLTPKEMLEKIYKRFSGAEKFVQDVLNGLLSQAKNVTERTLIRWPNKKSSLSKEANLLDDMNHYNEELLEALKLLSQPL
jgi:predicted RNA-binding Zn-ribbon protein involved in translation (DUF1610 family)